MTPLWLFGRPARAKFKIPTVEQRLLSNENKALRGTKDVPGRYQHHIDASNRSSFTKWQRMLDARAREADLHQARRGLGNNHLPVRRDVITMRVRNESERFCIPWIQPEILLRQVNTAVIANLDHHESYFPSNLNSIAAPMSHVVAR